MLKDQNLLRNQSYINGKWVDAPNQFAVEDPATGECLIKVTDHGGEQTKLAIDAAEQAQINWARLTVKERSSIMRRWHDLILEHQEDLAMLMTREQGKPLAQSMGEIAYAASFVEFYAEEAKRVYGEVLPSPAHDRRFVTLKQPIGVGAGITPWNFPSAMITRKAAPALAVGCAMVIKPAEGTPLSALALAELAARAGLPDGVLNVVVGNKPAPIGTRLCEDERVRALSFTGSTAVGKHLLSQMASTVKKASMELGGNAPFIIFDDADPKAALEGLMLSKFRNSGQTCVCANRILIQDGIYDKFMDLFRAKIASLTVGNGLDEGIEIGPLINEAAIAKVDRLVDSATSAGAKAVIGGAPHALGKLFYQPTLLEQVKADMAITHEEIFGPVAPVLRFKTEQEAVSLANDTPFGLSAYFYARDHARVWRVSEALEYGIVGVNCGIISSEMVPFGGVKQSGLGREGAKHGIEEWTELKYIAFAGLDS